MRFLPSRACERTTGQASTIATAAVGSLPAKRAPSAELATASLASKKFYHPELDGLRFFAFFAVFVFHQWGHRPHAIGPVSPGMDRLIDWTFSTFIAGQAGVDLFFLLSAYLITRLLVQEQRQTGRVSVKSFYIRRLLRIWPLYYAFLAWSVLFESSMLGNAGLGADLAIPFAVFLGNWKFTQLSTLPNTSAVILWTVSIEEQFYLIWPLLFCWLSRSTLVKLCWGLIGSSFLLRVVMTQAGAIDFHLRSNTLTQIAPLCVGILFALRHESTQRITPLNPLLKKCMILLGMLLVVLSVFAFDLHAEGMDADLKKFANVFFYLSTTVGSALVFRAAVQSPAEASQRPTLFSNPVLVYLGRVSYGLYVFHMVGNYISKWYFLERPWYVAAPLQLLLALAITTALAVISYYLLEKPFLKLKVHFTKVESRPGG